MIFSCQSENCKYYDETVDVGCSKWMSGVTIRDGVCDDYDDSEEGDAE